MLLQFMRANMRQSVLFVAFAKALLIAATPLSAALVAPSASDPRFGWDQGDAGSTYAAWDVFSSATGTNLPDVAGATTNTVTETIGAGFLTSGGNIYSPAAPTAFVTLLDMAPLSGSYTRIVAQFTTLGAELDYDAITINSFQPTVTEELSRINLSGQFGGSAIEYLALWDFGTAEDDYLLNFASDGSSMSLDKVRVDAFARNTTFVSAVPEPSSFAALFVSIGVAFVRRRKRFENSTRGI